MSAATMLQLAIATLLPVGASAAFYLLERNTRFGRVSWWVRQIIIGVIFGLIAIFGTEFGISMSGATINVRDAAPLTAGLLFGGPAGIIAGIIGGVERWLAASWGRGIFTQIACSTATVAAGFYGASLRKRLFDGKRPTWAMGLFIGVVVEVLHLLLIFLTNMDMAPRAFAVVRACSVPMILLNAISVTLSIVVLTKLAGESLHEPAERREISQSMQSSMLVVVVFAFICTSLFTFYLQVNIADDQLSKLFSQNISDVEEDLRVAVNDQLLSLTRTIAASFASVDEAKTEDLSEAAKRWNASEINFVDGTGCVVASSNPKMVGYDMRSIAQTDVFLECLQSETGFIQDYETASPADDSDDPELLTYAAATLPGGFVQVGYSKEIAHEALSNQTAGFTRNRHVGESGSILIVDSSGIIRSASDVIEGEDLSITGLDKTIEEADPGTLFNGMYFNGAVKGLYEEFEGFLVIGIEYASEAEFARNVSVLVTAFMEVLVFASLFAVIYIRVKRLVVDNIHSVNQTLACITAGDLNATVNVRSNLEFAMLSDDINSTVDALKHAIAEAAARLNTELEYARTIQRSALPRVFPPYPNRDDFDLYANMSAAKEVGGDFYDFYLLDDDHLLFLIADVSGKGIPAAMFMMSAKTTIESLAESGLPINEVFEKANERLCENNEAEMFVTCWMGVLDVNTGIVRFCNAGHNPPVLARVNKPCEYNITRPNMVLAGLDGMRYRIQELTLEPGDTLFLYTDGVTEATNTHDELFGEDRLLHTLDENIHADVATLCETVHSEVDKFVGEAPQFDDITVLALRFYGKKAGEQNEC